MNRDYLYSEVEYYYFEEIWLGEGGIAGSAQAEQEHRISSAF
jgi:hypothetical protein